MRRCECTQNILGFTHVQNPPLPPQVRLSLYETLGDLENKDLQLTLAMQDLTIATGEIKKVSGMRSHLDTMET